MRVLYFLVRFVIKFTTWVYYPKQIGVNKPKKVFARTIFMCNHSASFMDPLVFANSQKPIVFFMTRSDVFTPLLKPILWAAHMLPIYRQHDGEDTKKKNEEVFKKCTNVLKYGRSLLIYSEGFTDDVFIRRLKPVKKGAVRIGFLALEESNWQQKVFLQSVGINYSDPNVLGSDYVISNGDPICLNDYKERYQANSSKTISDLTSEMELDMRKQITDVRNADMAPFHENIMRMTRKGMHPIDTDHRISLIDRWKYSKRLAHWFNEQKVENNEELMALKKRIEDYFLHQKNENIEENLLHTLSSNERFFWKSSIFLVFLAPIMMIGMVHNFLPYLWIKKFVEKSFKRKVFWGSVKMVLGCLAIALFNIPILILIVKLLNWSVASGILYFFFVIPISGLIARKWFDVYRQEKKLNKMQKQDLSAIAEERRVIQKEIERLIPVA